MPDDNAMGVFEAVDDLGFVESVESDNVGNVAEDFLLNFRRSNEIGDGDKEAGHGGFYSNV